MDTTKFDQVTKEYSIAQLILDTHMQISHCDSTYF